MNKWHSFNFRIVWPNGQNPKWWVDILITDCIVRGVLSGSTPHVELWRVHRRAFPDSAGHEFTFDCFTTSEDAKAIDAAIQRDKVLSFIDTRQLLKPGGYSMEEEGATVESIAVPTWPAELQIAWPIYIDGVSRTLLHLIGCLKANTPDFSDFSKPNADAESIERSYQRLNDQLGSVWRDYGHDAFLHQVNAIFAYEPVTILGALCQL